MRSAVQLEEHYAFTDEDSARLSRLTAFREPARERVAETSTLRHELITRAESYRGPRSE
jgi:hypothetical protein